MLLDKFEIMIPGDLMENLDQSDCICILKSVHRRLERGRSKSLRWVGDGRAFEVLEPVRVLRLSGYVKAGIDDLEDVLLKYGFRKKESVDAHIYFHRHFRKGMGFQYSKMRYSLHRLCEYRDGFLCPSRWESGELDVRRWYESICSTYEATRRAILQQREAISSLRKEIERAVEAGVGKMEDSVLYRRSTIKGLSVPRQRICWISENEHEGPDIETVENEAGL